MHCIDLVGLPVHHSWHVCIQLCVVNHSSVTASALLLVYCHQMTFRYVVAVLDKQGCITYTVYINVIHVYCHVFINVSARQYNLLPNSLQCILIAGCEVDFLFG